MKQPIYDNGLGDKVQKAVDAGLLQRTVDNDGVYVYSLTQRGAQQLKIEALLRAGFNV